MYYTVIFLTVSCQSANYYYKYLFYWLNFYLVSKYKFAMQKSALTVANIQIQQLSQNGDQLCMVKLLTLSRGFLII